MTYRTQWNLREIKKYDNKSQEKRSFILLKIINKELQSKKNFYRYFTALLKNNLCFICIFPINLFLNINIE